MNCPAGHFVPDNALACPTCTVARGEEALRLLQHEFLRRALKADSGQPYPLRVTKTPERHVLMYETKAHTFCGIELKIKPQIKYERLDDEAALRTVCAACRAAVDEAVEEALQ